MTATVPKHVETISMPQYNDLISILSVCDGKIIAATYWSTTLSLYDYKGSKISTIALPDGQRLCDAALTSSGEIICVTGDTRKVLVLSSDGQVKKQHQMTHPRCMSTFSEGGTAIHYLADYEKGVYRSTDHGLSWQRIFQAAYGNHCWQVSKVKVSDNDCGDTYWTVEGSNGRDVLREYCVGATTVVRDFQPLHESANVDISRCRLLCLGGGSGVLVADCKNGGVHLLSTNGQYQHLFLSSDDGVYTPARLAIDCDQSLLFVAQFSEIKVFAV